MKRFFLLCVCVLAACSADPALTSVNSGTNNGTNNVTMDMGGTEDQGDNNNQEDMNNGPTDCLATGDCPEPQVCALTDDGLQCVDPTGNPNGAACTDGSECASGICLNGACADPCEGESDCPAGYTCQSNDIPTGNGTVTLNVCVEEPTPCLADADCPDPQVCVIDTSMGAVLECGTPVGGGDVGDACAMDSDCQSGLCLNDICTAPCERPNDCSTDGSFICEPTMVNTGNGNANLNLCVPRPPSVCLSDADCTLPERCVATKGATDVEFACGTPNANGGETSDACNADTDCAQNLCVQNVCAGPCQGNGDCAGAQDYSCDLVNIDLGAAMDTAQICAPPVVCDESDDCRVNETCYIRNNANMIDLLCLSPNVGGGSLNQVCGSNLECADNLCLSTRFRDVCTNACADNTDCTVAGYTCQPFEIVPGTNINVCSPSAPPACTSNDDCGAGTTCSVILNAAGNGLESVCVPETGGDASGVACNNNEDCASLLCVANECVAPCDDSNDCPNGQLCTSEAINKDGQQGTFDLCTTPPDTPCTSSDDCLDGVRVCGDLRLVQGNLTPFCGFPNAGGAQLGTACMMDNDCRENVCLVSISNECSVVCDKDADCGATQGCTTYSDIGFCNTVCADNGDCGNNTFCTINGDTNEDDIDQVCQVAPGAKLLGDTCAGGAECQTGLCLTTYLFNGTSCTVDANCNAGETCECPLDNPNCVVGKECATQTNACTNLCDDNTDCLGGVAGNQLTDCSPNTVVALPSGQGTKTLATCAQP